MLGNVYVGGLIMNKYAREEFTEWDVFCKRAKKFKNTLHATWIFRGNKPGKRLESSLDRAVKYYPDELNKKNIVEERLLRNFKRRYHQYSSDTPEEEDDLEWFSIMQHYGAPTRLLDFTYSIYVAAHFALEHTDGRHFEVFAVNAMWAIEESIRNNNNSDEAGKFFGKLIGNTEKDRRNFKDYFMSESPKEFVCPFNPFRLTERISLQNSVFMCPGNVNKTFENNLKSLNDWHKKSNIVKLILKFNKQQVIRAREYLYDLNITRATLFPGLEGFAESLTMYPPKVLSKRQSAS